MRKMLLGIWLAVIMLASLILIFVTGSEFWLIAAIVFFVCSAYCTVDGYLTWGPKAREDGDEDDQPPLPPQYK